MNYAIGVLSVCILLMAPPSLSAQEEAEQSPWKASVGLGYSATRGNSDTDNLAITFQKEYTRPSSKWTSSGNLTYATTEGDESANKGALKTQYDLMPTKRFFYFGKFGISYDRFAQLDLRTAPGGGAGYDMVKQEKVTLSGSAGADAVTDFFSDDTKDTRAMLALTENLETALSDAATLQQSFSIQNNFEDFGDYLIDFEVSVTTDVMEHVSLKVAFIDKYDSTPFSEELDKNDVTFLTTLNYEF